MLKADPLPIRLGPPRPGPVKATAARRAGGGEERCCCGKLLARLTAEGLEILCRRCKRKHLIRRRTWVMATDC